jgi:hypothetical protein
MRAAKVAARGTDGTCFAGPGGRAAIPKNGRHPWCRRPIKGLHQSGSHAAGGARSRVPLPFGDRGSLRSGSRAWLARDRSTCDQGANLRDGSLGWMRRLSDRVQGSGGVVRIERRDERARCDATVPSRSLDFRDQLGSARALSAMNREHHRAPVATPPSVIMGPGRRNGVMVMILAPLRTRSSCSSKDLGRAASACRAAIAAALSAAISATICALAASGPISAASCRNRRNMPAGSHEASRARRRASALRPRRLGAGSVSPCAANSAAN